MATTLAPAGPPALHARGVTSPIRTNSLGCRTVSRRSLTRRVGAISGRGWKRPFEDPIPLPRGRQLVTLEDAGSYITKLPKAEHEAAEWQAAMEALILVATLGGPTMFARIGMMRALHRKVESRGASLYQSGKKHKFYVRLGGLTTKRFRGLPKR
jgi:hypothetical protein